MTAIGNSLPMFAITEVPRNFDTMDDASAAAIKASREQILRNTGRADEIDQDQSAAPEGVKVNLSEAGKQQAVKGSGSEEYADIEDSDLPSRTQSALKNIRDLQRKLAQLRAELDKIHNDKDLDPQIAQIKISNLTSAMSGINAALMKANDVLGKAMEADGLNSDRMRQAQELASPPR
ncbi:hypothetical protein [Pseudomonas gingeri]|uniref:Uncharacterized protein n=1 Tax=Pseudomonas gingeri TaxID=117681 RepID=A0A7Y8CIZ8_9PSED|nr:hypothetical protein [Pseudomonas gingeri]NWA00067.1 hypothetical protein [Pseudomonas gingeri]NWA16906.1 hypothetical protein [Pseudomonas gingeri]NWA53708.1 hypothetical protein [Pseudomonas gingeri]NWA93940.1 hypothetical protein [Pseudomonas gingeri]NWB02160.1 hypothetical protein [Pseudomonas gingeri]